MGNENSQALNLEFDEKAVQVTDFWIHHCATLSYSNPVSVFISEPFLDGSLWISQTPLERITKNLKLYRHPSILKYISSWRKGSKFFLVVEDVKPLSLILSTQTTMQICIGLYSILKAICFLHDNASVSHNNICISSIYVTKDGDWHLGGMEYLCKFTDVTEDYLQKISRHRYDKAIDVNENKCIKQIKDNSGAIDSYAFGILVNEVLQNRNDEDILWIEDFFESVSQLNGPIISRPKLSSLLDHKFFVHDFIMIQSFLIELPLKTDDLKMNFFLSLFNKLRSFNEAVVAKQLGGLLLSRLVLLDKTAQQHLLPYVLCPLEGLEEPPNGLFTIESFKEYIIPKLLQIFCVRDAQIRLLLLEHFHSYMSCFSKDELQLQILPELLVGIKDTNDHLVAMTLKVLADIVPILGAVSVIGGKRAKLFNDGRPIIHTTDKLVQRSRHTPRKSQNNFVHNIMDNSINLELPERPSPDGEENETNEDLLQITEDDLDIWDDWDVNAENTVNNTNAIEANTEINENSGKQSPKRLSFDNSNKKQEIPDVLDLDIKSRNSISKHDDIDYFQDMEPVIETSKPFYVVSKEDNEKKLNLGILAVDQHQEEGWSIEWD